MAIIFLDVCRVLVSRRSTFAYGSETPIENVSPECCYLINKLLHRESADDPYHIFVYTSSDRMDLRYEHTIGSLQRRGFNGRFHKDWVTDKMGFSEDGDKYTGREILTWLADHVKTGELSKCVVLDGGTITEEDLQPRLIKVDRENGFSIENYVKCRELLGMNEDESLREL